MSAEEQAPADFQSWQEYISYRYRVKNNGINKLHLEALRDPLVFLCQQLVTYSRCEWWGDLMTLRGALMTLRDVWHYVPGRDPNVRYLLQFSEQGWPFRDHEEVS